MKSRIFFGLFLLSLILIAFTTKVSAEAGRRNLPVCAFSHKDEIRCHAKLVVEDNGNPLVSVGPSGYGPNQFRKAYNLTEPTSSASQIIAIVIAYDHPYILQNLNTYSQTFGIPTLPKCSVAIKDSPVPCFQKVDQNGGTSYPAVNQSWALETALDVEVTHAICQKCKILLVEANAASYYDLMPAINKAVELGATVISNSYGSDEFSSQNQFDSNLNHPGVAITFSSGDGGFRTSFPASSHFVTSVGGTTLLLNPDNSYQSETAWSGSGSGCSLYDAKPAWQKDSLCSNRMVADVAADADPSTGAAIYSSVRYNGRKGWFQIGGTSLSSPLVAGVYALAGGSQAQRNSTPYLNGNSSNLHDVTLGSNGSCGGTYFCTSGPAFDGPTGLGSPNGLGAF